MYREGVRVYKVAIINEGVLIPLIIQDLAYFMPSQGSFVITDVRQALESARPPKSGTS